MENENDHIMGDVGGIPNYMPNENIDDNHNFDDFDNFNNNINNNVAGDGRGNRLGRGVRGVRNIANKTSPFVTLIGALVIFWMMVFLLDVPYDIDVYRHYIVGTCFFHNFYNLDWLQYDESSYSFQAIAEVLVNTNKNTKKELKELYPNIVITSTTDYENNNNNINKYKQQEKDNNINQLQRNSYLYLPFKTNISIDTDIGEMMYTMRGTPFEVSSSPYSHPHRCFFHPVSKNVAIYRSVLPLFNVFLLALSTLLSTVLVCSHRLRNQFNQLPILFLVYILVQVISLSFLDTVDYTFYDLAHQIISRIIVIAIADLAYEFLTNSHQERVTFHFLIFILYLACYYHVFI